MAAERVTLAPLGGHVEALRALAAEPEVARWARPGAGGPWPPEAAVPSVDAGGGDAVERFAVVVDGVGPVGACGLERVPREAAALVHYFIGRGYWGRGFGTEALARLVAHAFGARALDELQAMVLADNAASLRLLAKVGFVERARLRVGGAPIVYLSLRPRRNGAGEWR